MTAFGHRRGERGHQQVGRLDVDGEHLVDLLGRGVGGGAEGEDAAAVDEDVDVAAADLGGLRGELAHAVLVVEVGGDEVGGSAGGADAGDHGVAAGLVSAGHDDVGAEGGQLDGGGFADAAGGAGDQGGGAGQVGGHENLSISGANTPNHARMILECQLQNAVGW